MDTESIHAGLLSDVKDCFYLYDANFSLPFETDQFTGVIATEVIEHIINYEQALEEICRVTKNFFIMTVPDISSIPICHQHNVVP